MEKTAHHGKGNAIVYLFKKSWQYSEGNRRKIVWFWIMFIVAISITLFAQPLVWAKIINVITEEGVTSQNIKLLFSLLLLLFN